MRELSNQEVLAVAGGFSDDEPPTVVTVTTKRLPKDVIHFEENYWDNILENVAHQEAAEFLDGFDGGPSIDLPEIARCDVDQAALQAAQQALELSRENGNSEVLIYIYQGANGDLYLSTPAIGSTQGVSTPSNPQDIGIGDWGQVVSVLHTQPTTTLPSEGDILAVRELIARGAEIEEIYIVNSTTGELDAYNWSALNFAMFTGNGVLDPEDVRRDIGC